MGATLYIRMDRGDEVIKSLIAICQKEQIRSATYSGIGGCSSAAIQTFDPAAGAFHTEEKTGMLELVSLMGNIISDGDGTLHHHTHAMFSYVEDGEHKVLAGHLKETAVLYTAEIELRPVDGIIGRKHDPETGTGFWNFE
jgi:predicted DNA-binding protein with PD1-like motif